VLQKGGLSTAKAPQRYVDLIDDDRGQLKGGGGADSVHVEIVRGQNAQEAEATATGGEVASFRHAEMYKRPTKCAKVGSMRAACVLS
jgi:hypothetical protein